MAKILLVIGSIYNLTTSTEDGKQTCPFLQPEASLFPSGDHAMHSIQCLWALQVCSGVSVNMSHSLTVVSPDPLARDLGTQTSLSLFLFRSFFLCPLYIHHSLPLFVFLFLPFLLVSPSPFSSKAFSIPHTIQRRIIFVEIVT